MTKALKNWGFFLAALLLSLTVWAKGSAALDTVAVADLPKQAQQTLLLIKQGGPFPYPKDGAVFGNYEGLLPKQKRGYYHEYTVQTPGLRKRGARRIVVGAGYAPAREYYYTDDHYAHFKRIKE